MTGSKTRPPERPQVSVRSVTANTCEVNILTEGGDVRLVCSHEAIEITADNVEIRVRP